MSRVTKLYFTLDQFEDLVVAIVAQACSDMYGWGRRLVRKNYYDPSDPEAIQYSTGTRKNISKKKVEDHYNEAKEWLTDPNSEFNTYYKAMIAAIKDSESCLNGKQIAETIDMMIENVNDYPEDQRSFRQDKSDEVDSDLMDEDYDD